MSVNHKEFAGQARGWPRVLVVDDQPQSVELVAAVLDHAFEGATIFRASSGGEALAIAAEEALDVIVLDAHMPGLDGMEVCRSLKAANRTSTVPVLMISGIWTESADRVLGIESGADGYLCKPFENPELVAQVSVLLRVKRAEDELRMRESELLVQLAHRESALVQSESRFQRLFERSPDPIFVESEKGVVLAVNQAACDLHGMTRSELVGRNVEDLVPQEERASVARAFPNWFTGELHQAEGLAFAKDGRKIPVDISASVIEYDEQRAVLLHVRDISVRRETEAVIRLSESRYRAIVEDQTELVCRADPDTKLSFVNEAVERYFGVSRQLIVGRRLTDFVPKDERPAIVALIRSMSAAKPVVTVEHRFVMPDGRIRWHQWVNRGMFDSEANLVEIQSVGRDITERLEIENRQKTLLRGMRAIVEIADDLIAARDEDTLYRLAVEFARSKLGIERAGILLNRDTWLQGTFGTDYTGHTTDERDKRIQKDQRWAEVLRLRKPEEPRWTVSQEQLVYWEGDRMAGDRAGWVAMTPIQTAHKSIGVFCNDTAISRSTLDDSIQEVIAVYCSLLANIAERKSVEDERARLALAVDQSAESIIITDTKGVIQYANPGFERMSGFTRGTVIGKTPQILKSGKHGAPFYRRMWSSLEHGQVWTGRLTNRRSDGTFYEVEQTISPIRDSRGQIMSYLCVAQDITTAVQMENELRQAQKMESIGRLAGGIAHDFNNLLTAILGFSRMVANEVGENSELHGDVTEIINAAERASRLTRQLLSFGRKQVIQVQAVDLNALVTNMEKMLRRTLGEHVELITELDPDIRLIEADPGQIEQIIMNVAINSYDAMPKGGRLEISTRRSVLDEDFCHKHLRLRPGEYTTLTVRDNGCGMPEDVRERAFEPFFTTKEKGRGSGLGLATVYGIVKQTHGHIELSSESGVGTVMTIHLPVSTGELVRPQAAIAPEVKTGTETILVAEDEAVVRRLTVRQLRSLGYHVIEARDGEEALELFELNREKIHMVLTDVVMPKLSGPDLINRLRKTNAGLRHVFMSGFAEDMLVRTIESADSAPLIMKPFTREILAVQVRVALDRPVERRTKPPNETEH